MGIVRRRGHDAVQFSTGTSEREGPVASTVVRSDGERLAVVRAPSVDCVATEGAGHTAPDRTRGRWAPLATDEGREAS